MTIGIVPKLVAPPESEDMLEGKIIFTKWNYVKVGSAVKGAPTDLRVILHMTNLNFVSEHIPRGIKTQVTLGPTRALIKYLPATGMFILT